MTHLIDGDDLAVIVEPVGLGAKDLHLRWGWREVGRIGGQHSIRLGSILDLSFGFGNRAGAATPTDGPIARCRSFPRSSR